MAVKIRRAGPLDAEACSAVIRESFDKVHDDHGFHRDAPSPSQPSQPPARQSPAARLVATPGVYGLVAESEGKVVGCGFMDERDEVWGIGPLNVDPESQGRGIGRTLMLALLRRGRKARGMRLLQDTFNPVSMALYTSLGFVTREPMAQMKGRPLAASRNDGGSRDLEVRKMEKRDLKRADALCERVHGFTRTNDLRSSLETAAAPWVATRDGGVVAYVSSTAWGRSHGVARTTEDMTSLLSEISRNVVDPFTFLLPTRDTEFFRWALESGLRIFKPMTLMTIGFYREPSGCYFPSITY